MPFEKWYNFDGREVGFTEKAVGVGHRRRNGATYFGTAFGTDALSSSHFVVLAGGVKVAAFLVASV